MSFVTAAAVVGAGSAAYSIGKGISQAHQANVINKNNIRPNYTIPQELTENLNIANSMAQTGLPQQQYDNQLNQINRNQAGALNTVSRAANPANIASIVRAGNDAGNNLNSEDAAARARNLQLAMSVRGQLAQQKLAQQQYNLFDKYTENYNKAAALQGASAQNINNGINGASGIATGLAESNILGGTGGSSMFGMHTSAPTMAQNNAANDLATFYGKQGLDDTTLSFNKYLQSLNG